MTTKTKTEAVTTNSPIVRNRYDALLLIDVEKGNPNGNPDNGGSPRIDPVTQHGYMTDVCLKRKVRDYIVKADPTLELYVKKRAILADQQARAYQAVGLDQAGLDDPEEDEGGEETEAPVRKVAPKKGAKKQADLEGIQRARDYMCKTFWDISAFGAVFAGKGPNALGRLMGPIQMTFANSVDPIRVLKEGITRVAVATVRESVDQGALNQTMGVKYTVPYGLYAGKIFVSPLRAAQTGFTEKDLDLYWQALERMWDEDSGAARGYMAMRKLIVFKHSSPLGNASSASLFDRINVGRKPGVDLAMNFRDYDVSVDTRNMPGGVELMTFPR